MTSYKDSGVSIDAAETFVKRLKKINPDIGSFAGLFPLGDNYLVSCTDGVGTKLKCAIAQNKHDTIGIDLVAMSANDLITTGAAPLFFLDYFATGKLDVDQAETVVQGILAGCKEAGLILLGGETAEMPGMYKPSDYDLAGFAVGIVEKSKLIDGKSIQKGDLLAALPSSGLHSNGYSLARKILGENDPALLTPTKIYVKEIQRLQEKIPIKGMAHITGGGLTGNIPRMLPDGLSYTLDKQSWHIPDIFQRLQKLGNVSETEMFQTFNMGVGMVLCISEEYAEGLQIIGKVL